MKTDIWMPLYVKDYLASTSRLTTVEHGAYLLLLFDYWINGSLPNNNDVLLQITKQPKENLQVISGLLSRFFILNENNQWVNERIEKELLRATHNREIAKENGKKGGRPPNNNLQGNLPVNQRGNPKETSAPAPAPAPLSSPKPSTAVVHNDEILNYYSDNIHILTPNLISEIQSYIVDTPKDWLIQAMNEAVRNNKKNWAYIETILKAWKLKGSVDKVKKKELSYTERKAAAVKYEKEKLNANI